MEGGCIRDLCGGVTVRDEGWKINFADCISGKIHDLHVVLANTNKQIDNKNSEIEDLMENIENEVVDDVDDTTYAKLAKNTDTMADAARDMESRLKTCTNDKNLCGSYCTIAKQNVTKDYTTQITTLDNEANNMCVIPLELCNADAADYHTSIQRYQQVAAKVKPSNTSDFENKYTQCVEGTLVIVDDDKSKYLAKLRSNVCDEEAECNVWESLWEITEPLEKEDSLDSLVFSDSGQELYEACIGAAKDSMGQVGRQAMTAQPQNWGVFA